MLWWRQEAPARWKMFLRCCFHPARIAAQPCSPACRRGERCLLLGCAGWLRGSGKSDPEAPMDLCAAKGFPAGQETPPESSDRPAAQGDDGCTQGRGCHPRRVPRPLAKHPHASGWRSWQLLGQRDMGCPSSRQPCDVPFPGGEDSPGNTP